VSGAIGDRVTEVRRRIAAAAEAYGRDPSAITLIVVGKTWPAAIVSEAVAAGVTDLGENRVQEAAEKKPQVPPATWHLIGPLQRNKARPALELFDVIHTVDRIELARRLQQLLVERWPERRQHVLIEVNLASETQKAGVEPSQAEALARGLLACDRLRLLGLMAVPPFDPDPEASRAHFRLLRAVRDRLEDRLGTPLPHLSMGMSHDYEIAIAEGATMVRVGTAIFGSRS
jgi:pyridoxal phosphate enzyme (YggS family)